MAFTLALETVLSCRLGDLSRVGAVPGDSAIHAQLLQRDIATVVGQYHRETGCPAFDYLHLENRRGLCKPFRNRLA